MNNSIETAKSILGDARPYLENRGVTFTHDGKFTCPHPGHNDRNPSASIDRRDPKRWKCWSCGAHGDVLDLFTFDHNMTIGQAVKTLVGVDATPYVKPYKLKPLSSRAGDPPKRLDGSDLIYMQTCADDLLASPVAIIQHARWRNWNRKTILHLASDRSLGISKDGRLAFLYMSGVKYRNPDGRKPKVIWEKGSKPAIWRIDQMKQANPEKVFITEGETDAITLIDLGAEVDAVQDTDRFDTKQFVVALPSAGYTMHPQEAELFRDRVVVFFPDEDNAGRQAVTENRKRLSGIAKKIKEVNVGR